MGRSEKRNAKAVFLHTNASWQGRKALHRLRQTGSVRKYVRQFQSLMMKIGNMAEEYKVFRFEVGLQEWARKELQKRNLQDLASAIRVAEGFLDYGESSSTTKKKLRRTPFALWRRSSVVMRKERLLLPRQSNRENLLRRTQDASSAAGHIVLATAQRRRNFLLLLLGTSKLNPPGLIPRSFSMPSDTRRSLPLMG